MTRRVLRRVIREMARLAIIVRYRRRRLGEMQRPLDTPSLGGMQRYASCVRSARWADVPDPPDLVDVFACRAV